SIYQNSIDQWPTIHLTIAPSYLRAMVLSTTEVILSAAIALLIGLFAAYLFWAQRRFGELEEQVKHGREKGSLQLAAYERLTLLTERLKLNNLASRLTQSGLTARDLQQAMLAAMREELDHNITQQLYVKKEIWDAVVKMKEQNSFILNQVAATLPPDAAALELSKKLVQFATENPTATLNALVLDAIRHEAQEVLQ
ncbi:MAG TPA: hypothetical protein VK907_02170, partial [Phnomibacter sp.]|nr:hypothetical protein [Phnomibacter sp.]